jgi:hypothetical protein
MEFRAQEILKLPFAALRSAEKIGQIVMPDVFDCQRLALKRISEAAELKHQESLLVTRIDQIVAAHPAAAEVNATDEVVIDLGEPREFIDLRDNSIEEYARKMEAPTGIEPV